MGSSNHAIRYAIYTRQSAEPRDGLSSCEAQFQVCLEFARSASRPGDAWIGERFDDQGERIAQLASESSVCLWQR